MNDDNNRLLLPVFLTLQDGRELSVELIVNLGGAIDRTMNNEARFILVAESDGSERLIAKDGILEVRDPKKTRQTEAPVATTAAAATTDGRQNLNAPSINPRSQEPHHVLGLPVGATEEQIRTAFATLAQAYNPDRLAHMGLPVDVVEFCNSRYRQVTEAYGQLTEGQTPVLAQPQHLVT